MKLAVFDLGTNVFNLLIARVFSNKCDIERVVTVNSHIGRGGFANGALSGQAIESSMKAIGQMLNKIEESGGADVIKAFATSAVRDASNGNDFIQNVKDKYNLEIEMISGEREAELVYKGIRESILLYDEKVLMVDIGGGSNELIIADKDNIYWKRSFPLGVIRIKEMLTPADPITRNDIEKYHAILDEHLASFFEEIQRYKPKLMIGSSGSFDTLREIIYPGDDGTLPAMNLTIENFGRLHAMLLASDNIERLKIPGMSEMRAEYMVLGSIFVDYLINKAGIEELYQSSYSLKEGYMSEFAEQLSTAQ